MSASLPGIVVPSMGIDVGFFSTKYSLGRASGRNGGNILVEQFPSLAPRNFGGSRQLPTAGRQDVVLVEAEPGVFHHVGKDVFDTVSSTASRAVVSDFSMSSAYKALFLGALYYAARHFGELGPLLVQELVVGLPLSTIYTHADALQTMAQGTHTIPCPGAVDRTTTVEVEKATVVAQPHGALISHVVQRHGSGLPTEGNTLVLDMGGGTFDWFVSRDIVPNYQRCGAVAIGALACSTAVCKSIKAGLQDDPEIVARLDKALPGSADTVDAQIPKRRGRIARRRARTSGAGQVHESPHGAVPSNPPPHSAMRLDREAFRESLDDMKNAINPTPALPSSDKANSAGSTTPDWRGAFRLSALDLNPDLHSTFEPASPDSAPDAPTASHWILEDRLLSRMVAALQADAAELAQWQQRRGAASAVCSPLVLIRQLGFEHQPRPATALDQLRFMVRFMFACVALSTRCICRAAVIEQQCRHRPT